MDERELETLFRDATGEPPPPEFTVRDVAVASAKVRSRRRSAVAVAVSCVALVLAGAGVAGFLLNVDLLPTTTSNSADSERGVQSSPRLGTQGQPGTGSERPPNAAPSEGFPTPSPKQGGEGSGENGPRAESTPGCDKVDRELATALAGELPVTVLPQPSPGRVCTANSRSAGFQLQDGMISATVLPPGTAVQYAAQPAGTVHAERPSAHGGTVLVLSTPRPGSAAAPLPGDVERIAGALAARF